MGLLRTGWWCVSWERTYQRRASITRPRRRQLQQPPPGLSLARAGGHMSKLRQPPPPARWLDIQPRSCGMRSPATCRAAPTARSGCCCGQRGPPASRRSKTTKRMARATEQLSTASCWPKKPGLGQLAAHGKELAHAVGVAGAAGAAGLLRRQRMGYALRAGVGAAQQVAAAPGAQRDRQLGGERRARAHGDQRVGDEEGGDEVQHGVGRRARAAASHACRHGAQHGGLGIVGAQAGHRHAQRGGAQTLATRVGGRVEGGSVCLLGVVIGGGAPPPAVHSSTLASGIRCSIASFLRRIVDGGQHSGR